MRLYYASDIHGSEVCWRKFLNAGKFYRVDALVMGGDFVGKAIVPIEIDGNKGSVMINGKSQILHNAGEFEEAEKAIRDGGFYPYRASRNELEALVDSPSLREALFEKVVRSALRRWLEIAAAKVDMGIPIYVMPGNDDPWFIDDEMRSSPSIIYCNDNVVDVGGYEMVSFSYANPTPWDSPRELNEEALLERLESILLQLHSRESAIFNLHVPPYGSGLDQAPRLDDSLRPVTGMGHMEMAAVGSTAVRRVIEQYQPLLSLHGHIHESRGIAKIGRTVALNPGSEYPTGRIHGALVELAGQRVVSYQLVSG
jgi:Icc-related predicted phosphoesterase